MKCAEVQMRGPPPYAFILYSMLRPIGTQATALRFTRRLHMLCNS